MPRRLPRNSVGTAQLKRNAVTSAKVRNGSLLSSDSVPASSRRGPAGPRGLTEATGPVGATGATGAAGRNAVTSIAVHDSAGVPIGVRSGYRNRHGFVRPGRGRRRRRWLYGERQRRIDDSFSIQAAPSAPPTGWEVRLPQRPGSGGYGRCGSHLRDAVTSPARGASATARTSGWSNYDRRPGRLHARRITTRWAAHASRSAHGGARRARSGRRAAAA
jgi:hypothetical protein